MKFPTMRHRARSRHARSRGLTIYRGFGRSREEITRKDALALATALPAPKFESRGPWCDLDALEIEKPPVGGR